MTVDVTSMLRLTSPAASAVQLVFLLTQFIYAGFSIDAVHSIPVELVALALTVLASVLLTRPNPDPFPLRNTVALVGIVVAVTVLMQFNLPHSGWPGYAMWNLGATTWLLVFLALRGRVGSAWIGFALVTAASMVWTSVGGSGPLAGLELVSRHTATLVVGTLFAVLLRRVASRISVLHDELLTVTASDAAAQGALRERDRQAEQLELVARPALLHIEAGLADGEDDRRRYTLIEGALRDTLRGGTLATSEVSGVVLAARQRGVEVVLLDDSDSTLSVAQTSRVIAAVIRELSSIGTGRFTVRLLPAGRDTIATIVGDLFGDQQRLHLPAVEPADQP